MENAQFKLARPVWAKGMEAEMNTTCRFQGMFDVSGQKNVVLRVAAATIYRVWLNGELVAYGPARCGHGHYRVDEWPLEATVRPGENAVVIEVAG